MNKLDRFRFGNLHKRRIFMLIMLFILLVFVSVMFLVLIGFFGSRAELPRIMATAEFTSERTEGVGINILEMPDANIIEDPFLSKTDRCVSAEVSQVRGNYIYFAPSEASVFENLLSGDSVNILSIDGSGRMGLRYSGNAVSFSDTQFGVPLLFEDTTGLWHNSIVEKSAEASGVLFLLTQNGNLISNAAVNPEDASGEIPFADICAEGISVYAVTTTGDVYISTDGGPFSILGSLSPAPETQASSISVTNGNINVFMSDGTIKTMSSGHVTVTGNSDASLVETGDGFMVTCTDRELRVSRNGLFMSTVPEVTRIIPEVDRITDLETDSDSAFVLTEYGKLVRVDMSGDEPEVTFCDISSIEPVSICPAGGESVIAVTSDRQAYLVSVSDGTPKSLGLTGIAVDDVMRFGQDRFVIRSGNDLYSASLMAALEVDLPVADGVVLEGDICQVKSSSTDTDSWDLYGSTTLVPSQDGMSIIGAGEGIHAVSRVLEGPSNDLFEKNLFYRIEVTMSSNYEDVICNVWLEGDEFGRQGMHNVSLSEQSLTYTYVFVVTEQMLSDESIRFNISFENEAIVNLESIYIGLDRYGINSVPTDFTDGIIASAPAALRFGSITPGGNGYCDETFYGVGADSLEQALCLCKNSGADPWIVLGSSVSQSDVDNLLGYLCGSVSNEYGSLRINNGTALPWSRQFDTLYIEINDMDGTFPSDSQRGAYVTYIINLFAKSQFYLEIKDKIVFVDGMTYESGVVLSTADRHASGIVIEREPEAEDQEPRSFISVATDVIEQSAYNAPRSATSGALGGEFISSFRVDSEEDVRNLTAADVVSSVLRAETTFSDLIMFDSDMDIGTVIATLKPLMNSEVMYSETLDPLDSSSDYTSETFNEACDSILVDGGESLYLIVSNPSDSMQQFTVLCEEYDISSGNYRRYSSNGSFLIERELTRYGQRQLLQPGEFMVIEIPK